MTAFSALALFRRSGPDLSAPDAAARYRTFATGTGMPLLIVHVSGL